MVFFTPLVDHTFMCVVYMIAVAPSSIRTEDQASSASQILGFCNVRTIGSGTPGSEYLSDTDSGSPVVLPTHIQYLSTHSRLRVC